MTLREQVILAPLTTFKIGGPARYFVEATSLDDVRAAVRFAEERALPLFVLGGGSNILIADEGFPGVVLALALQSVTYTPQGASTLLTAGAGVAWDALVADTVAQGLAGFECLSGIPGTVGGAVVANLGAYGAECSDTFLDATILDREDPSLTPQVWTRAACQFSYHHSYFADHPGRYIVLEARFALTPTTTATPDYADSRFNLAALVAEKGRAPTLAEVREAVIAVRAQKGVLESSYRSAGSFFHMPFVSREQYEAVVRTAQILDAAKEERLRPWAWEQSDGSYKIAPGFLLEYTPYQKGYATGAVGISPKHTLSVITSDGATARDVAALARGMQDAVRNIFSITLAREVKYIGDVEK